MTIELCLHIIEVKEGMVMYYRIKEARKAANLTQRQLADMMGIKVSTLSGYEIGAHDPGSNKLTKIAQICNTTVDWLLGVDMSDTPPKPYNERHETGYETIQPGLGSDAPDVQQHPAQPSGISDIVFALSGEIHDLTEDEMQDVLDYVRFKRAQKARQEAKP